MRTSRTNAQATFEANEIPVLTPEAIDWVQNRMQGPMPAHVHQNSISTPLHLRTEDQQKNHRTLEASLRELGAERLLYMNEIAAEMRGELVSPPTVNRPASPPSPRPAFPPRPRLPHVALNIEPTSIQSQQTVAAPIPAPVQQSTKQCGSKACLIATGIVTVAAGIGISGYFIYRQVYSQSVFQPRFF